MTGLVVLLLVLAAATAFGMWRRKADGRFRATTPTPALASDGDAVTEDSMSPFTPDDLGTDFGTRATFVQFSSAFCQPCRATRATLTHLAATEPGVVHVEVDAESRLDLVRRVGVHRTPTTFVLDGSGRVVGRSTGAMRIDAARAAVPPKV